MTFLRSAVLTLVIFLIELSTCESGTGQESRTEILHDRYKVTWQVNFDTKTIDFWIECRTNGFVGFGLSHSGSMAGADLVIGGVRDGEKYFGDYYATANQFPNLDPEQNWIPLDISEDHDITTMHLRRDLDTCDVNGHDLAITEGTIKIIWSIGTTDTLQKHEIEGALAVNMLDPPVTPIDLSTFHTHNMTQTVTMNGDIDTIYWCSMFKREARKKSHIVAFQPKFDTEDALKYTHHFNVYTCKALEGMDPDEVFGPYVDLPGQNCLTETDGLATVRYMCYQNLYAWSKGGRILVFPENIGLPWGVEGNEYYFMEVHLDNQDKTPVTLETGVTIYYSDILRPIEGGLLAIGHSTSPSLLIPPEAKNWTLAGHCSPHCTQNGIRSQGINIFNVNLHAHMSGIRMRFRQFRNGIELPWISNDMSYDFDYQENRPMAKEILVLPGDHLTMECTFDSTWKKPSTATIGGPSSYEEMCMVFAFYHPRTGLEACFSDYPVDETLASFGITNYTLPLGSFDPVITEPVEWINRTFTDILTNEVTWTDEIRSELLKELRFGTHVQYCFSKDEMEGRRQSNLKFHVGPFFSTVGDNGFRNSDNGEISYPDIETEYEPPNSCFEDGNHF